MSLDDSHPAYSRFAGLLPSTYDLLPNNLHNVAYNISMTSLISYSDAQLTSTTVSRIYILAQKSDVVDKFCSQLYFGWIYINLHMNKQN